MPRSPAWSPAGDRIVYVSRVESIFDLYVLNLRKNQIVKLTESNARNESPAWSPDGRHLVFTSNLNGGIQIYEHRLRRGQPSPADVQGQQQARRLVQLIALRFFPGGRAPAAAFDFLSC